MAPDRGHGGSIGRQKRDAETAAVAHHRPIVVERFDRKTEPFVFLDIALKVFGFDRQMINRSRKSKIVFVRVHKSYL